MKKKVIRLTEAQVTAYIKKIVSEQSEKDIYGRPVTKRTGNLDDPFSGEKPYEPKTNPKSDYTFPEDQTDYGLKTPAPKAKSDFGLKSLAPQEFKPDISPAANSSANVMAGPGDLKTFPPAPKLNYKVPGGDQKSNTTPSSSTPAGSSTDRAVGIDVAQSQRDLISLGYDLGHKGADGYMGPDTQKAILAFQKANFLTPTGKFDLKTATKLQTQAKDNPVIDAGASVTDLQNALRKFGNGAYDYVQPDGIHGPQTTKAVKNFQASNNIPITGDFDQKTIAKLGKYMGTGNSTSKPPVTNPTSPLGNQGTFNKPSSTSNNIAGI